MGSTPFRRTVGLRGSKEMMVTHYGNPGVIYSTRCDLDQAEAMFQKPKELFRDAGALLKWNTSSSYCKVCTSGAEKSNHEARRNFRKGSFNLRGHVDRNVHAQSVGHVDQTVQAKIVNLSF